VSERFSTARRWIGRLAFSLLIIAFILLWEARKYPDPRASLMYVAAGVAGALGLIGLRERHRKPDDRFPT
jgi:hypothetical protein